VTNSTDAYRAYVKDADYVWGSNEGKSWLGVMYGQMVRYGLSFSNHASYKMAALDYLHYLHGVNPLSYMMLSNTASIGSDKPVTEIYHLWTGDGTSFDTNPIPGLVSGGMNSNYSGTNTYFSGQPIQKKYLNFNTSFPENSWELSEPAIYYQAAYLRLAATALPGNVVLPLSLLRFTGSDNKKTRQNKLDWQTTAEVNVAHFAIERSENSVLFQEIGRVSAKGQSSANINNYTFTDNNRSENAQYYRLKIIDKDNTVAYSATIFIDNKGKQLISVFPNPGQNELNLVVDEKYTSETIFMYNAIGVLVKTWTIFKSNLDVSELPAGTYFIRIGDQTINWKKGSH
jgi:hypothetical protein